MQFSAELGGLTAKDKSDGKKVEVKLTAQFDESLFAELGGFFGDQVHVQINHPQGSLDFAGEKKV
jgi:hypothetical protein